VSKTNFLSVTNKMDNKVNLNLT